MRWVLNLHLKKHAWATSLLRVLNQAKAHCHWSLLIFPPWQCGWTTYPPHHKLILSDCCTLLQDMLIDTCLLHSQHFTAPHPCPITPDSLTLLSKRKEPQNLLPSNQKLTSEQETTVRFRLQTSRPNSLSLGVWTHLGTRKHTHRLTLLHLYSKIQWPLLFFLLSLKKGETPLPERKTAQRTHILMTVLTYRPTKSAPSDNQHEETVEDLVLRLFPCPDPCTALVFKVQRRPVCAAQHSTE